MMRSLFSAVSGLRNHQVRMDVIGNNVANVNTVGYKASRVTFQESFAQTLSGATRPQDGVGGTNPVQVGLGMKLGSVDTLFTQGGLEATGRTLDLAIQGNSFFVLAQGDAQCYSRAGDFMLDAQGRMVSASNGARVQGRSATAGVLGSDVGDLKLPIDQQVPAQPTRHAQLGGNLDASAAVGDRVSTSISVFDSQGGAHELKVNLQKTGTNSWTWSVDPGALESGMSASPASGALTFTSTGVLDAATANPTITLSPPAGGAFEPLVCELQLGPDAPGGGLTQYAGSSDAVMRGQDGYTAGKLESFEIDSTGTITGRFSNGTSQVLGQVALADFANPGGLTRGGDNLFTTSPNSGTAVVRFASGEGGSTIASGMLEMSNVDLTREFTDMIVAQRGFQANGRVITSTDEMLQEIVNLKR